MCRVQGLLQDKEGIQGIIHIFEVGCLGEMEVVRNTEQSEEGKGMERGLVERNEGYRVSIE